MRPTHGLELFDHCLTCEWRSDEYFCNVDAGTLAHFDSIAFANVYPPGSVLFSEGQMARGLFVLCHGTAKLSISSGDGKTLITRIARHGEVLGLASVLSGNAHGTSAETLEPSQVKFIRRDDFLRFLENHHELCARVTRQLVTECEGGADQIRALGLSHSASEKLAHLILVWATDRGKEVGGGTRIQMLMTHEDISQIIGTTRETVTRLLREFRERNLITVKGASLTILNKATLEALVLH